MSEITQSSEKAQLLAQITATRKLIHSVERDLKEGISIMLNNLNEQLDSIRFRLIELEDKAESTQKALYCG